MKLNLKISFALYLAATILASIGVAMLYGIGKAFICSAALLWLLSIAAVTCPFKCEK